MTKLGINMACFDAIGSEPRKLGASGPANVCPDHLLGRKQPRCDDFVADVIGSLVAKTGPSRFQPAQSISFSS